MTIAEQHKAKEIPMGLQPGHQEDIQLGEQTGLVKGEVLTSLKITRQRPAIVAEHNLIKIATWLSNHELDELTL